MDAKLAMKIWHVMDESESIEKDLTVGKGNSKYSAVSEAAVLNAVKPSLKKHKLIIVPIDVTVSEVVSNYTVTDTYNGNADVKKTRLITQLVTKWKIIDAETGEFEILAAPGNGADPQDKGSGKAWTYSYKCLLQKTFCLFSGEDTDNTHSSDIGSNSKPAQEENKVTTAMLQAAIDASDKDTKYVLDHYNENEGKSVRDIKFISQPRKQYYYKKLGGK